MKIHNTNDLFTYLDSLNGVSTQKIKDIWTIFLPDNSSITGKKVESIDSTSINLLSNENIRTFIYTDKYIANLSSYNLILEANFTIDFFLQQLFEQYPSIIPSEYSSNVLLSDLKSAFSEMQQMRIKLKKLSNDFDILQNENYQLQAKKNYLENDLENIKVALAKKSKLIVDAIYFYSPKKEIISKAQIEAIFDYDKNYKLNLHNKEVKVCLKSKIAIFSFRREEYSLTKDKDLVGIGLTQISLKKEYLFFNKNGILVDYKESTNYSGITIEWEELAIIYNEQKSALI